MAKTNTLYLHSWLDCPDVILRRNYAMQDKINEARNYVFYKLKQEGKTGMKAIYAYQMWVQKNRQKLKLAPTYSECFEESKVENL